MSDRLVRVDHRLPEQRFSVLLRGEEWRFRVYYNGRTESWYLDVADAQGVAQVSGVRLVGEFPILEQYRPGRSLPEPVLFVLDRAGRFRDPGRESWDETHVLVAAETAAQAAAS